MTRDPSYLAGYNAALASPLATATAIEPPADYTQAQRLAFVSGFMVGARDARDRALIEELERELGHE